MKVQGRPYRTIWLESEGGDVSIIDQTKLPHEFSVVRLRSLAEAAHAIRAMLVRGAPLIGASAAWGLYLGMREDSSDTGLAEACETLLATRPTAVNLRWAIERVGAALRDTAAAERVAVAASLATEICDEDVDICRSIGEHGAELIRSTWEKGGRAKPVQIMTHCNAGWLATVDWGTATAPIYVAHEAGVPVHVWVDETRPRNQGASLTAWELGEHGVPCTLICDNAGGHLMTRGEVDLLITGTDRTTANGDVANKIGTYLKALAAADNRVPFYVALPGPTIDWTLDDGASIRIEERGAEEVTKIAGRAASGRVETVDIAPPGCKAANPAFDVTPARLLTGLITERGICEASQGGLAGLYPERSRGKAAS